MSVKKSEMTLKSKVRKPASEVTKDMINNGIADRKTKKRPSYKLSDLLAEVDPNAPMPEDIKAWMEMKPVRKEII